MHTWGLMLSFIPFGWNSVFKLQYLGVELPQVRRNTTPCEKCMAEYCLLNTHFIL